MATYYVDGAAGTDTGSGTITDPWKTMTYAATHYATGDTVYVKASATYAGQISLPISNAKGNEVTWEGYSTTPGDGGRATLDVSSSGNVYGFSAASKNYYVIKNFHVTGAYYSGFYFTGVSVRVENCVAGTNRQKGFYMTGQYACLIDCTAYDNGQDGIYASNGYIYGCWSHDNSTNVSTGYYDLRTGGGQILHSVFSGSGANAICYVNGVPAVFMNNVVDGKGVAGYGVYNGNAFGAFIFHNNIIMNCGTGFRINTTGYPSSWNVRGNVFDNVTTEQTTNMDYAIVSDNITGTVTFTSEGTSYLGYELAGSVGVGAGIDGTGASLGMDAGIIQTVPSTGTGTATCRVILTS
jgi:hypothetical protein